MVPQHVGLLALFTVRVCTGYVLPEHVCVLAVFTVCVCTGHISPQHVRVLAVLQYVCNEAYSYVIVNISYMLMAHGVVVWWLITSHTYECEVGLLYVRQCKK